MLLTQQSVDEENRNNNSLDRNMISELEEETEEHTFSPNLRSHQDQSYPSSRGLRSRRRTTATTTTLSGIEDEEDDEEDDEMSQEVITTRNQGRKRQRSIINRNNHQLSQGSLLSQSQQSSQHHRNGFETIYHLYIIWNYNKFYCKIGITSSNSMKHVARYKTYLANFIYWFIPISIQCRWEIAKKYENLVHTTLSK
jgi:hypothetical protein